MSEKHHIASLLHRKAQHAETESARQRKEKKASPKATPARQATTFIKNAHTYPASLIETVRHPILILDAKLRVYMANRAFYNTFKAPPTDTEGVLLPRLGNGQWNIPALKMLLLKILPQKRRVEHYEVRHVFPVIGEKIMLLNARVFDLDETRKKFIILAMEDVTTRIRLEQQNEKEGEELKRRLLQQETVAQFGLRALEGISLPILMQEATDLLTDVLETRFAKVMEYLPERDTFIFRAGVGWRKGVVGHATLRSGRNSQVGYAFLHSNPVIFMNLGAEKRFKADPLLLNHHVVSGMNVLIQGERTPFGVLGTCADTERKFTQEDTNFLQAMANILGQEIERRKAEETIKTLNAGLEQKVSERTRELRVSQDKDKTSIRRLKEMMQGLPLAAIAVDEHGIILQVNDVFCEYFRLKSHPSEMIGNNVQAFIPVIERSIANAEKQKQNLEKITKGRMPVFADEIPLTDGRILLRDYIPVFEDGKFHGQLFLYRDVTQERRVDRTKSEFMSLASHQLRTPLTTVRWSFGKLQKRLAAKTDSLEKKLLEEGRKAAVRMNETIDTMLQISRIESGQMEMRRSNVDLCVLFNEMAALYKEEYEAKQQKFTLDCRKHHIRSDIKFLKEILGNLIGNAIKYTPEGGTIGISIRKEDKDIFVEVKDTGYGIPDYQQAKIFRKFFRGDNIVSRDTEGSGLGLYLVSLLTQLLHGTVSFASVEGKGTTFTLRLPLST